MKCFHKSTRWSAEALGAVLLCLAMAPAAQAEGVSDLCLPGVTRAIVADLKQRMSGAIEFRLSNVSCTLAVTADDLLRATVSPGARTGRAMRFTIARFSAEGSGAIRVGEASATVNAVGPAIRTTHDVPRAAILGAPDVEAAEMSLDDLPVRPVLALPDVIGARTSRPLRAGELVDDRSVVPVPAVRSGDRVHALMRMPEIEVEAVVIAIDSGALNQVITVVNPATRRALRARVTGHGQVEVVNAR